MIIDTHCHYNLDPLYGENGQAWQAHWQEAQAHDVTHSLVVGTTLTSSKRAVELCQQQPKFRASIGYHPYTIAEYFGVHQEDANSKTETTDDILTTWIEGLQQLLETANNANLVSAIGETGLDYFRLDPQTPPGHQLAQLQQELFKKQIALADKHQLPLILHVRGTDQTPYTQTLELIKTYKKSDLPFILHCISGSTAYASEALEMGAYIGIAGNVTYKNAEAIREIIRFAPKDRLLLETDAPYLPPVPHRGHICEPWMIQLTGHYVVDTFGVTLEQLYANTLTVFPSLKIV